jgi:hypothetical protein
MTDYGSENKHAMEEISILWIGGKVNWSTYSDGRIKKDIRDDVKGLSFINKLKPVTNFKDLRKIASITHSPDSVDFPGKFDGEHIRYSGFVAQDVEKAAKETGYEFSGIHKPKNQNDLYSLTYVDFVISLVKAVQEQQAMIEEQRKQIALLQEQNGQLEAMKRDIDLLKKQLHQ